MAGKRGRRGFGAIRKLPSGRYQASYVGPDTARHKAPSTYETREDAEAWLSARRAEIVGDDWRPPRARKTATFGPYAESWLRTRVTPKGEPLKPRTRANYRQLLDLYILPGFAELPLKSITPASVREWHAGLARTPTARARAYSLLKSILSTAVEDGELASNPCRIKGASNVRRAKQIRPATVTELAVLVEATPARLRLAVLLAAWAQLRYGEIAELRRKDIDVTNGLVKVRRGVVTVDGERIVDTPKSAAGVRTVALPPHLLPAVKQHLQDHAQIGRDGLLFYQLETGEQLPYSTWRDAVSTAAKSAGRPDLSGHDLRHTGATLAAQSGATIAELMARLGHTTSTMAMRYQHASDERDRELAIRLSRMAEGSEA